MILIMLFQCNLGFCYASGIGVAENPTKAVFWYRKAAQQNHARALQKLALHLQGGIGCHQNLELAVRYFGLAAQQGQVAAQYHLALCYEKGLGTQVDLQESLAWFERAATVSLKTIEIQFFSHILYYRLVVEILINVFVNFYFVTALKMLLLVTLFKELTMQLAVGQITHIHLVGYLVLLLQLHNFSSCTYTSLQTFSHLYNSLILL